MGTRLRILWFSNIAFTEQQMSSTGTWIVGMASALQTYYSNNVSLYNITQASIAKVLHEKAGGIEQWILPCIDVLKKNDFVSITKQIHSIIDSIKPNLIHIWGTEAYWGMLPFGKMCPNIPVLLDMQGYVKSVVDNYYGDLTLTELLKCISIKELLKPSSSLYAYKLRYKKQAKLESGIINKMVNISVQSDWMEACIKSENEHCRIFRTGIALRNMFYQAEKWNFSDNKEPIIFTTASLSMPLKGLSVLLKAFVIVKKYYPNAVLYIAGFEQKGIRECGYSRLLKSYMKEEEIVSSVKYLGALKTDELIKMYQKCSLFVNPSMIESYSLVVAEAMALGVPTVATYAGAMCELGIHGSSILHFPKGDYIICATQIMKILENPDLAISLSYRARKEALKRNEIESIAHNQYVIYCELLKM